WIRRATIGIAMIAAVVLAKSQIVGSITHLTLAGNLQFFLAGFLLADIFLLSPRTAQRSWRWDIVTVIGWPVFVTLLIKSPQIIDAVLPAMILLLYVAALYGRVS